MRKKGTCTFCSGQGTTGPTSCCPKCGGSGETAPDTREGVHRTHCCIKHGCKYGDDDHCPVATGRIEQDGACHNCGEESEGHYGERREIDYKCYKSPGILKPKFSDWNKRLKKGDVAGASVAFSKANGLGKDAQEALLVFSEAVYWVSRDHLFGRR